MQERPLHGNRPNVTQVKQSLTPQTVRKETRKETKAKRRFAYEEYGPWVVPRRTRWRAPTPPACHRVYPGDKTGKTPVLRGTTDGPLPFLSQLGSRFDSSLLKTVIMLADVRVKLRAEPQSNQRAAKSLLREKRRSEVPPASNTVFEHEPVMLAEIVDVLGQVPTGVYVDATLGGAGHATALLERREDMSLIGIDRDPVARAAASQRLEHFGERATVVAGRFDAIAELVASCEPHGPVTGVLFDLGVSSPQFDDGERGFSYRYDAPLDMRMNQNDSLTAAEIVNTWSHQDLTRLLRDAADERFASRIAARLIDNRPIATTAKLAEIVTNAIPAATRRTGGHPAKRTFQALRIAVNDELAQIRNAVGDAIDLLEVGGRGAVLSYHSGEDRLVKKAITLAETGGCKCPPRLPCGCGADHKVRPLPPKLRRATQEEKDRNPRSSSALFRCFERI